MQVFHSVMTRYVLKRIHFSGAGMAARTQLAALNHNFNAGRHQAKTSRGRTRYKSHFSRPKGDYIAKKVHVEKSYDYVGQLMNKVQQVAFEKQFSPIPVYKSVSIWRKTPKKKADVVAKLQSRMAKLRDKKDGVRPN